MGQNAVVFPFTVLGLARFYGFDAPLPKLGNAAKLLHRNPIPE